MAKIVSLKGESLPEPGKPSVAVIEQLEWLLDRARDGQIKGVAAVFTWTDEATGHFLCGWNSYTMVGKLHLMQRKILEDLDSL